MCPAWQVLEEDVVTLLDLPGDGMPAETSYIECSILQSIQIVTKVALDESFGASWAYLWGRQSQAWGLALICLASPLRTG